MLLHDHDLITGGDPEEECTCSRDIVQKNVSSKKSLYLKKNKEEIKWLRNIKI
jgi:hypothetical protein